MKTDTILALVAGLALLAAPLATAQVNYQGRLTDASGDPVAGPQATINFSLHTLAVGGTQVWGPTPILADLIDGRFNVVLNIDPTDLALGTFLELQVGGDAPLPRQEIFANPRALFADEAAHASLADNFVSAVLFTDEDNARVGIGTSNPTDRLEVVGTMTVSGGWAGGLPAGGHISLDNGGVLYAKNLAGVPEPCLTPRWADGATYLRFGDGGLNIVENSGVQVMTVKPGGNVGIGTTTPTEKLHVAGTLRLSGTQKSIVLDNGGTLWAKNSAGVDEMFAHPRWVDNSTYLQFGSGGLIIRDNAAVPVINVNPSGNVGIGNVVPGNAKLQVNGWASPSFSNFWALDITGLKNGTGGAPLALPISIYANRAVAAEGFVAFSDERIKSVRGRSDAGNDLSTLMAIEITDYSYIDVLGKGSASYKKVIAQQVEEVYPQAVSRTTDVVPDIYQRATVKDGWVQLATDLKAGERVRLIGEKEEAIHEVLAVRDGAFRTAFSPATEKVFVYGRSVDDFRTVDYEAIAMLNVSATQELHRKLEASNEELSKLQEEMARLRTENAALVQKVATVDAREQSREARLIRLERALEGRLSSLPKQSKASEPIALQR